MNTKNFMREIEKTYNKHFPLSKCFVNYSGFYRSISVSPVLAGNRDEVSNGIWENDILNIRFLIDNNGNEFGNDVFEGDLPETITLECDGKSYMIKPDNQYMAYGRRKLSFRKVQGNAEKIIFALDKFFASLKKSLSEDLNADNIHDKKHLEICKAKL